MMCEPVNHGGCHLVVGEETPPLRALEVGREDEAAGFVTLLMGLPAVFERLGGVPPRLIFDNASAVGRTGAGATRLTARCQRFPAHYGFAVTLCNPYHGYEQGHVENKVGYLRRPRLVPRPEITDLPAFHQALLTWCEADWARPHYKKHRTIATLVQEDQAALGPLPHARFDPVRSGTVQTDGYGKFGWDGAYYYSTAPASARQTVTVPVGAYTVAALAPDGTVLATHRRRFGHRRTDSIDPRTTDPARPVGPEPRGLEQPQRARAGTGRPPHPPRHLYPGRTPGRVTGQGEAPRAIRRSGGSSGAHRSGPAGPGRGRGRHGPGGAARPVGAGPAGGSRTGFPRLRRRAPAAGGVDMLGAPAERLARRPRVAAACRRLSLSPPAVTLGEQARPSQAAFLVTGLEAELAHRETQRRTRLLNRAGCPTLKTLDGDDRTRVQLPSTLTWADWETGAYLATVRHLGLFGPVAPGTPPARRPWGSARASRAIRSAASR